MRLIADSVRDEMARAHIPTERAALGAMLLDRKALFAGLQALRSHHFTSERHQALLATIAELSADGITEPDLTLVDARLRAKGEVLPDYWLQSELLDRVPNSHLMPHYILELERLSYRRKLGYAMDRARQAYEAGDDDVMRAAMREACDIPIPGAPVRSPEEQSAELEKILREEIHGGVVGITTGFAAVDGILSGFRGGRLHVLAGATGVGKSMLAQQMALAAARSGKRVHWWTKEMPQSEMNLRAVGLMSGVNVSPAKLRNLHPTDEMRLHQARQELFGLPITWDDRRQPIHEMVATAMELRGQVDLFVVDHIQITEVENEREMFGQVRAVTRECKQMAIQTGAAVLALSQFNRSAGGEENPQIWQMSGGGSIEQDSDVIMILSRKEQYQAALECQDAKLRLPKVRGGSPGAIKLIWDPWAACYREA